MALAHPDWPWHPRLALAPQTGPGTSRLALALAPQTARKFWKFHPDKSEPLHKFKVDYKTPLAYILWSLYFRPCITVVFFCEAVAQTWAQRFDYFKDKFNMFDVFVLFIS